MANWRTRWLAGKQDSWLKNKMADWKTRWRAGKQNGGL
jgi:hypothetical protein